MPVTVVKDFGKLCSERGMPLEIALQKAMERFMAPGADSRAMMAADARRAFSRYLARARDGKAAPYLDYLAGIRDSDFESTVLVEIPSYRDPELRNTIESALAMAANPDRIRFVVCLQDDDPGMLAYLKSVPGCRFRWFAEKDAPGLCAARYECQRLYGGEDFVLHVDAHMRFARGWDVATIDQWNRCGDPKAVLSTWGLRLSVDMVAAAVDDDIFTRTVWMNNRTISPLWFQDGKWDLRMANGGRQCRDCQPEPGALICGHYVFGPGRMDVDVLEDRHMDFLGDEIPMAVRYYTHGYNVYHPCVACIHHLWAREARLLRRDEGKRASGGERAVRKQREVRRTEKLLGLADHPDVDLGEFGLGTERTLAEFERYAGVCFGRAEILSFADRGEFGGEHAGGDLIPIDWAFRMIGKYGEDRLSWLGWA